MLLQAVGRVRRWAHAGAVLPIVPCHRETRKQLVGDEDGWCASVSWLHAAWHGLARVQGEQRCPDVCMRCCCCCCCWYKNVRFRVCVL